MTNDLAVELACRHLPDSSVVRRAIQTARNSHGRNERSTRLAAALPCVHRRNRTTIEDGGLGRQAPSSETIDRYWVVEPGDLVAQSYVAGHRWWNRRFGRARRGESMIRAYGPGPEISPRYLHHLLRNGRFRDQYRLYTRADTTFDRRVSSGASSDAHYRAASGGAAPHRRFPRPEVDGNCIPAGCDAPTMSDRSTTSVACILWMPLGRDQVLAHETPRLRIILGDQRIARLG